MRHYGCCGGRAGRGRGPHQSAVERRREQFSAALCAAPSAVRDLPMWHPIGDWRLVIGTERNWIDWTVLRIVIGTERNWTWLDCALETELNELWTGVSWSEPWSVNCGTALSACFSLFGVYFFSTSPLHQLNPENTSFFASSALWCPNRNKNQRNQRTVGDTDRDLDLYLL